MDVNSVQVEALAQRVRDARLPSPAERERIRRAAGVTLRDMAVALGVSHMTVSRWERQGRLRLDQAAAYAQLLAELAAATASAGEGEST